MKASELITLLEGHMAKHGDTEIVGGEGGFNVYIGGNYKATDTLILSEDGTKIARLSVPQVTAEWLAMEKRRLAHEDQEFLKTVTSSPIKIAQTWKQK